MYYIYIILYTIYSYIYLTRVQCLKKNEQTCVTIRFCKRYKK